MPRRPEGFGSFSDRIRAVFGEANRRKRRQEPARTLSVTSSETLEVRSLLSGTNYVPNQVLVGVAEGTDPSDVQARVMGSQMRPLGSYGVHLMTLPDGIDVPAAIGQLQDVAGVKYAEPNYYGEWTATPNDFSFNRLWGMRNIGQTVNGVSGTFDADIDATNAWDISTGNSSIIAAVIDSGVDYLHPDLAGNIWVNPGEIAGNGVDDDGNGYVDDINGYDFGDNDANPMDTHGHGTHVAGTIGAVGNNGIGVAGVAWDVQVMALKFLDSSDNLSMSGAIDALNYAVEKGAVVSNHSYFFTARTQAFEDAIINARNFNHIVVVAAGNFALNNDTNDFFYPANFPQDNIVVVAATDQTDTLAGFSNFGVNNVDIGAPGVNIFSTTPANSANFAPNFDFSDGTSMAAPHVTGAVALLHSIRSASYTSVINALYQGADALPSLAGQVRTGGRLNVFNAIPFLQEASIAITPGSVREDAGPSAATLTIRKQSWPLNQPLTVTVSFDDSSEVDVPIFGGLTSGTIVIPGGVSQVSFPIDILDDTLLDGTQTVTFDMEFNGNSIGFTTLDVTDYETLSISIDRSSIKENDGAGAATVTVTRSNTDVAPPNNYVVSNNELLEFSADGNQVNSFPIPWPTGIRPANQDAHDVVTLPTGRIAVYNGTTQGFVSLFNPASQTWQHFPVNGLSTDGSDPGTGGIASWNNFVFLTDMETSPGNPWGAVRLNLNNGQVTRFAQKSPGYRLFVKDIFDENIIEVDPATGDTLNSIPMPTSNVFGFNTGLAFDGTNLWLLAGPIGNDTIYKLNPDTGAVLEVHNLGGNSEWDGLAYLNGLLYLQDNFIDNRITIYDPASRRIVDTLNVGTINGINISGGLAAIKGPDALLATSTFGDIMYEINPTNGQVINSWNTGMATTEYGVAVLDGEIYVGEFQSDTLQVFDRSGVIQRTIQLSLVGAEGVFALGGDDVKGLVTTDFRYRDISVGLDDSVYVLDKDGVAVGRYNPLTLELDSFFDLAVPVSAISVAADGTILGARSDGYIYKFDAVGGLLDSFYTGVTDLIDIELNAGGQVLATSTTGEMIRTSFDFLTPFQFTASNGPAFVAFGRHQTQTAGEAAITLTNSDPSEISLPPQIFIPAGEQSVTVLVDAVDDNILDGTQFVTITASNAQYAAPVSVAVDVLDAEGIVVDVLAASVRENQGPQATLVRVSRTDTGFDALNPYEYTSTQQYAVTTPQTILDQNTIISTIEVPNMTALVSDIDISLSLVHEFRGDLDVFLISPAGTRVELFTDLPGFEITMSGTTLDDEATRSILEGANPFTGRYRPEGLLSAFDGESPVGTWTLEITDDQRQDVGTLLNWSLGLTTVGLAPITVFLSNDQQGDEASIPLQVTIPVNQSEVYVWLDAIDDNLLDGTQTASIDVVDVQKPNKFTGIPESVSGYDLGTDSVDVTDVETLVLEVNRSTVSEAGGTGVAIGRLTRFNDDINAAFTVLLYSSDTSELTVPASVTIPAGQASVEFPIDAVDDALFDGTQTVTITAVAPEYGADKTVDIDVEDLEPSLQFSTLTPNVRENAGSILVTVTRLDQADVSQSMSVNLTSTDTSELVVPPVIVIPANQQSFSFIVTIVDDTLLDGTQTPKIIGSALGVANGEITINVEDHETLSVVLTPSSFLENAGAKASKGRVTRGNTNLASPITVFLTSSDTSELTVPASVVIPAGSAFAEFDVAAVNDPQADGPQNVSILATSAGYINGTGTATVLDHEPPVITGPTAVTSNPFPVIQWQAIPGATRYDVWVDDVSNGISQLIRNQNVAGTSFTPTEALGIGRYRVRVRAYDALEIPGFWSNDYQFRIDTAPSITSPSSSGGTAAPAFPVISWTAVADAPRYEIWIDNATTGQTQVVRRSDLTTTSYITDGSLGSGTYRVWVRAYNVVGEFGKWSNERRFTVLAPPTITAPTGGTFNRTPTFKWTAVTGATHYDLWVSNIATQQVVLRDRVITGTQYTATRDLPNGEFAVWVRAFSGSTFGEWSVVSRFSIGISPTISAPTKGAAVSSRPQFVWSSISEASHYQLWVDRMEASGPKRVIYQPSLAGTSFTATSDLTLGNYQVWVRAISQMGETTSWGKPIEFRVGPVLTSPTEGSSLAGASAFTWRTHADAATYELWVERVNGNTATRVIFERGLTGGSFTPGSPLAAGTYRAWIRAVSTNGTATTWGAAVNFTVASIGSDPDPNQPDSQSLLLTAVFARDLNEEMPVDDVEVAEVQQPVLIEESIEVAPGQVPVQAPSVRVMQAPDVTELLVDEACDAVMATWSDSEWWAAQSGKAQS